LLFSFDFLPQRRWNESERTSFIQLRFIRTVSSQERAMNEKKRRKPSEPPVPVGPCLSVERNFEQAPPGGVA